MECHSTSVLAVYNTAPAKLVLVGHSVTMLNSLMTLLSPYGNSEMPVGVRVGLGLCSVVVFFHFHKKQMLQPMMKLVMPFHVCSLPQVLLKKKHIFLMQLEKILYTIWILSSDLLFIFFIAVE
jgi:hypothetical protein